MDGCLIERNLIHFYKCHYEQFTREKEIQAYYKLECSFNCVSLFYLEPISFCFFLVLINLAGVDLCRQTDILS